MAVAVNNPVRQDQPSIQRGREKDKTSDLDKILKALQIANYSFGIASDIDKIRTGSVQRENLVAQNEEQKLKNTALSDAQRRQKEGILTRDDQLKLGQHYNFDLNKKDGAVEFFTEDAQGIKSPLYASLKQKSEKEMSPLDQLRMQNLKLQQSKLNNELAQSQKRSKTNQPFNNLDKITQTQVQDIAKTNAKVLGVKNGIDAAISQLRDTNMSEDLKLKTGENLLKLLNSAEGSDAVGAEESKRLGSLLEYKLANFTGPGSFVGRDIDLFTEQVENKSNELGQRIANNENTIEQLMSGKSIGQIAQSPRTQNKTGSIISEAQANQGAGQVVIQNGNKFRLNPKTNKYEFLEKVK